MRHTWSIAGGGCVEEVSQWEVLLRLPFLRMIGS
jgi:hypothetical protein